MSKLRRILSWLALAVCFAVLCVFLWRNVTDLLDSDMASDMIYADLLRQEGSLLSSNWYYSSEIRILSNHLFFTPLFYLTRDWHLVRFGTDRKSTRLNSSHYQQSRMPSSA